MTRDAHDTALPLHHRGPDPAVVDPVPSSDGRAALFPRSGGLRWAIGVLVVVVLAELAARLLVPHVVPEIRWYDAATQRRVQLMDDRTEVDVVFAGTSSAWQAFVPARFEAATGDTSFNAGLAGAVPVVTGPWIVDEVAPRLRPDLVVWGFTALDLTTGYGADQWRAYHEAIETKPGTLAELDRAASSVSELVRSRRLFRSVGTLRGEDADRRRDQIDEAVDVTGPDGERLDFGPADPDDAAIQQARLADFAIDPDDLDAIRSAVAALAAEDTTVVFVELPVPTRFREHLSPDQADEVSTTIRALGTELGVDVVDARDAFPDASFVDETHLDRSGTIAATDLLAQALDRLSGVPSGACEPLGTTDRFGFEWPVEVCRNR